MGGDFYDYLWLDEDQTKLGLVIADVTDKGMKAAMVATLTSGLFLSETQSRLSASAILNDVNYPLYLKTDKRTFITCQVAILDTKKGTLQFSNAGHPPPFVRAGDTVSPLKSTGITFPLGIVEKGKYEHTVLDMKSADYVVFYSDGVPEAMNENLELYGFDRLERFIGDLQFDDSTFSARDVVERILGDVEQFAGEAEPSDDVTIVVIKTIF